MRNFADPKDQAILLRERETLLYYADPGWTKDPEQAKRFPNEAAAHRASVIANLANVEAVEWTPAKAPSRWPRKD